MVARLAKGVLPANTQIHKDALLALHKSATVFVSYIASKYVDHSMICPGAYPTLPSFHLGSLIVSPADIFNSSNDNAQASGKKTIAPHDVIAALKDAELEHFLPRLEAELKSMFPFQRLYSRLGLVDYGPHTN